MPRTFLLLANIGIRSPLKNGTVLAMRGFTSPVDQFSFLSSNMKTLAMLSLLLAASFSAFADDVAASLPQTALLTAKDLVQMHAQAISRELVQLRLEEVAVQSAAPVDNDKLARLAAQQKALQKDLLDLVLAPLEAELKHDSEFYLPTHSKIVQLRKRIEDTKTLLSGIH